MDRTLRALNRFGLGARVGERARVSDPGAWLRAQLEGEPPPLPAPEGAAPGEIADAVRALRMATRGEEGERRDARQRLVRIAASENRAALSERVRSQRPYVERLIAFWSNHLCVSAAGKLTVAPLAGSYERDVIRRHVLGRFDDMVLASAKHPAMLFYLDNVQSIGPNSRGARPRRRARTQRGLNENYARELLELHTLGVNGGYTQQDVTELARILTGWSVSGPTDFAFRPELHEPGTKTLLGERYPENGIAEGEKAIRTLCRHPATAHFIATKLVTHFVSDEPPAPAVDRIARVFADTDGDLRALAHALIELPEAWAEDTRKFRAPQDWMVAVLRAFDAKEMNGRILPVMQQLRHPLWAPPAPRGFGDTTREWADPDSLLNRAELARTITRPLRDRDRDRDRDRTTDPRVLLQVIDVAAARTITRPIADRKRDRREVDPRVLLEVVDVAAGDPLRALLADQSIPAAERVALAIAGPAFQWR
ncbi:MAG: DUF1800 domain-containing protein [Gemmatimonadota bacterium]